MEHPLLFLSILLDAIGLPAHGGEGVLAKVLAPHMQYSYLAMIICIVLAKAATSRMEMIPTGMQNVMEAFVGSLDDFLYEQTHDRKKAMIIFPMVDTYLQLYGVGPGLYVPYCQPQRDTGSHCCLNIYIPRFGVQVSWNKVSQALYGSRSGYGPCYVTHRNF